MAILIVGGSRLTSIFNNLGIKTLNFKEFKESFEDIIKKMNVGENLLILVEDVIYKDMENFIKEHIKDIKEIEEMGGKIIILEIPTQKINYKELIKKYLSYELEI